MTPLPPRSPLFPYTTLFRSQLLGAVRRDEEQRLVARVAQEEREEVARRAVGPVEILDDEDQRRTLRQSAEDAEQDRKSTRLNSSHSQISYAVFCLKKKNNNN